MGVSTRTSGGRSSKVCCFGKARCRCRDSLGKCFIYLSDRPVNKVPDHINPPVLYHLQTQAVGLTLSHLPVCFTLSPHAISLTPGSICLNLSHSTLSISLCLTVAHSIIPHSQFLTTACHSLSLSLSHSHSRL